METLVTEGPARVRELVRLGAGFDRHPDGTLMLTREGGHRTDRIVHAGGDATGAEVQRALEQRVRRDPWIRLFEHALVVDLVVADSGRAGGVTLHVLGEGTPDGVGAVLARAVVLATGGTGQVFASTTNPEVSTGDGVALALRAGATVTDLEFIQFHPTALRHGDAGGPQQSLISEALRGEGARLVDRDGERFMPDQHELAELAPRDVVAKSIHRVMRATGAEHVWLDARHLGRDFLVERFPTIVAACRAVGIEPADQLVPVAPAAHYASGGVRTDLYGRTSVPGLYACGEVACTGVHGANRLASNSLLEALVFARRIAADIARDPPAHVRDRGDRPTSGDAAPSTARGGHDSAESGSVEEARRALQQAMTAGAGVLRSGESLAGTLDVLARLPAAGSGTHAWELANLAAVATAVATAAYARTETRGCHWRDDFPTTADRWRGHLHGTIEKDGTLRLGWEHG